MRKMKTGKAIFFHAPSSGSSRREVVLSKVIDKELVREGGGYSCSSSIEGIKREVGGSYIENSYSVKEGEFIKCFINVRPGYGKMPRSGSVFLRVRSTAAYRRLVFPITDSPQAIFKNAEVEGTFDVVSMEEAIACGVHVPSAYKCFGTPENVESILKENIVIREEMEEKVVIESRTVTDGEGNEAVVRQRRRRRKIG